MTTAETILKVRKKLPFILLATVLTAIVTYFFLQRNFSKYSSETSFYVNENVILSNGMGHVDPQEATILGTIASNKVLLLLGTDELRDSIVRDFDLYKHYGIDPNTSFARESVMNCLNKNMVIRRDVGSLGVIHLTVEDKDRFVAAAMANKIVERVNRMNKEILQNDLKKKKAQYDAVLPEMESKVHNSREQFLSFVDSLGPADPGTGRSQALPPRARIMATDLVGTMDKSATRYDQMLDEYYSLMATVKTLGNDEWQCVTVVKKALPDIKSWNDDLLLYDAGISALALIFYICILVYFYQNQDQLELLMLALLGKPKEK